MIKATKKSATNETVEAVKWTGENSSEIKDFCGEIAKLDLYHSLDTQKENIVLHIRSIQGYRFVDKGDYIIKAENGEIFACKPDTFGMAFDVVPTSKDDSYSNGESKMNKRNFYVLSLKHLYPWKFGDTLCLWGNRRTKDDEERCYGGYSDKLDRAELYSRDEFLEKYGYCTKKEPISSLHPNTLKALKKSFDCVFLPKDVAESYYKAFGFATENNEV